MNSQVRVGIFTLIAVIGAFATYYFISNYALRHGGYGIGVRFHDVGGLQEGSSVLLSGVQVGEVTSVQLLPDETVDVICTINPGNEIYRDSVFMVAITFTGQTTLTITPPVNKQVAMILPQQVLPEDQQPWGSLPPTLTDLISNSQEQLKQLSKTLAVVNKKLPVLMTKFTDVAYDTDHLITHTDQSLSTFASQLSSTIALLNSTVATSGRNLNELTGNVNALVGENRGRLASLIDNLSKTASNLNKTMEGIAQIAQDPVLHESLVGTVRNVEDASAKLKAITTDIQNVTGDPQTQAQLKGTIANLDSVSAKANDILSSFSSAGATGGASPAPPASGGPRPPPRSSGAGLLAGPIAQAQVRETWSNRGGGPNSDVNVVLFPAAKTHVSGGANDLGYSTTYNVLLTKTLSRDLQVSGGVEYSKLGLAALFVPFGGPVGIDARLYDPKHPTLDLYGDLRLAQRLQLFYGERSIWGTTPKLPSFGVQIEY